MKKILITFFIFLYSSTSFGQSIKVKEIVCDWPGRGKDIKSYYFFISKNSKKVTLLKLNYDNTKVEEKKYRVGYSDNSIWFEIKNKNHWLLNRKSGEIINMESFSHFQLNCGRALTSYESLKKSLKTYAESMRKDKLEKNKF